MFSVFIGLISSNVATCIVTVKDTFLYSRDFKLVFALSIILCSDNFLRCRELVEQSLFFHISSQYWEKRYVIKGSFIDHNL